MKMTSALMAVGALALVPLIGGPAAAAPLGLKQLEGPEGCIVDETVAATLPDCLTGRALLGARASTASPDGRHVYVVAANSSSIAVFRRAFGDGALRQLGGEAGCIVDPTAPPVDGCATGRALEGAFNVTGEPGRQERLRRRGGRQRHRGVPPPSVERGADPARGHRRLHRRSGQHHRHRLRRRPRAAAAARRGRDLALRLRRGRRQRRGGGVQARPGERRAEPDRRPGRLHRRPGRGRDRRLRHRPRAHPPARSGADRGQPLRPVGPQRRRRGAGRDRRSGALSQNADDSGCIVDAGSSLSGCAEGRALDDARGVAASRDGRSVYVAARNSEGAAAFKRDRSSGGLAQVDGETGCIVDASAPLLDCAAGRALLQSQAIAVSRDGRSVYNTGSGSNALDVFARLRRSGGIRQLDGAAGCIVDADGPVVSNCDNAGRALADAQAVTGQRRRPQRLRRLLQCQRDRHLRSPALPAVSPAERPRGGVMAARAALGGRGRLPGLCPAPPTAGSGAQPAGGDAARPREPDPRAVEELRPAGRRGPRPGLRRTGAGAGRG